MGNTTSNINNSEQQEQVLVEKILFDSMYHKKIGIFDWFLTKLGFYSLVFFLYMLATDRLNVYIILGWLVFCFTMLKRSTILLHTKDISLWLKLHISDIMLLIEQKKDILQEFQTEQIIEETKLIPKKRNFKKAPLRNTSKKKSGKGRVVVKKRKAHV